VPRKGCEVAPTVLRKTQYPRAASLPFRGTRPLLQKSGLQTAYCPGWFCPRINLPFLSSGMVEPGSWSIFTLPTWSPME